MAPSLLPSPVKTPAVTGTTGGSWRLRICASALASSASRCALHQKKQRERTTMGSNAGHEHAPMVTKSNTLYHTSCMVHVTRTCGLPASAALCYAPSPCCLQSDPPACFALPPLALLHQNPCNDLLPHQLFLRHHISPFCPHSRPLCTSISLSAPPVLQRPAASPALPCAPHQPLSPSLQPTTRLLTSLSAPPALQ